MNDLQIFNNSEFGEIRIVTLNDRPMFCLSDICKALDLTQPSKVRERLNEKGVNTIPTLTTGGTQNLLYINEGNLYKTIFQSRKENAEKFTDWVTSEVLPAIRKHGAYMTERTLEQALTSPDFLIKLATELKTERAKRVELEMENAIQRQQLIELNPKATYYDLVLQCKDLISTTEIAKDYGKSAKWLNKMLADNKIQFKQGKIWILYKKYAEQGYTQTKTDNFFDKAGEPHTKPRTCWTQKGRLFIYDFLKGLGVLPIVEREQEGIG